MPARRLTAGAVPVLRLGLAGAVLAAAHGVVGPGLMAQESALPPPPRVVGAVLEARLVGTPGEARVEVRYRLRPHGADTIPLAAVEFFDVRLRGVEARAGGGDPLEVAVGPSPSGGVEGALLLPPSVGDLPEVDVVLSYGLMGEGPGGVRDFDVVLPVLMVDWGPEGSREQLFTARVVLPADHAVVEAFPMVPREVEEMGESRSYRLSLPVVPSMVRFRGRIGEPPLLTLGRWVDLGVILALLVLATVGWRALQRAESEQRRVGTARRREDER